jgi:hypothetical protein
MPDIDSLQVVRAVWNRYDFIVSQCSDTFAADTVTPGTITVMNTATATLVIIVTV